MNNSHIIFFLFFCFYKMLLSSPINASMGERTEGQTDSMKSQENSKKSDTNKYLCFYSKVYCFDLNKYLKRKKKMLQKMLWFDEFIVVHMKILFNLLTIYKSYFLCAVWKINFLTLLCEKHACATVIKSDDPKWLEKCIWSLIER